MSGSFPRHVFIRRAQELGHSEKYLRETLAYSDKLSVLELPVIFSRKHLPKLLGVRQHNLDWIISNREYLYSTFRIRKKHSSGVREIKAPCEELKLIQTWINQNILIKVPLHERCMSFRPGRSIKDNAEVHVGQPVLFQTDFYRFYETISERRVFGVFRHLGYHPNLAVDFAKLTTIPPGMTYEDDISKDSNKPNDFCAVQTAFLPQGAPTSPLISNIVARRLDHRLHKLASIMGAKYTRYADDITISGTQSVLPSIRFISDIVREEGFYLNLQKTHYTKKGQRQLVTGLTVTKGVHVPRKLREEIRQHLYYCKKLGPLTHMENRRIEGKGAFKDWLLGNICFIHGIDPNLGQKLFADFSQIDWIL